MDSSPRDEVERACWLGQLVSLTCGPSKICGNGQGHSTSITMSWERTCIEHNLGTEMLGGIDD
jgi:hypothetical protein